MVMVWAPSFSLATTQEIDFFFLFLALLRCFSSRGFPSSWLCVHHGMLKYYLKRVSPFGYLRIYVCLRLPGAFRRLLRPSSALSAWASTIRPF